MQKRYLGLNPAYKRLQVMMKALSGSLS